MPKRRKCPYKVRADGRILVWAEWGRDPKTGKRLRKAFYGSPGNWEEVEEKAKKYANEKRRFLGYDENMTFCDYAQGWLERRRKDPKLSESIKANDGSRLANAALDVINDLKLCEISRRDIKSVISALEDQNKTRSTLSAYICTIRSVFNDALENEFVDSNPVLGISLKGRGSEARPVKRIFTNDQIEALFAHEDHPLVPGILVMAICGLRPSEMLALNWTDIDMVNRVIRVYKSMDIFIGIKEKTKTAAGTREVIIPIRLNDMLKWTRTRATSTVFCSDRDGGYWTYNSYARCFLQVLEKIGEMEKIDFEGIVPYSCRHTAATMLYKAGVDEKAIIDQMGHTSINMTNKVYIHPDIETRKAKLCKLDRDLNGSQEVVK